MYFFKAELLSYRITNAKINEEKALIDAATIALREQEREIEEALQAKKNRDAKFDELDSWMGDFIAIARIAGEEKPQLMEKLGVVVPS